MAVRGRWPPARTLWCRPDSWTSKTQRQTDGTRWDALGGRGVPQSLGPWLPTLNLQDSILEPSVNLERRRELVHGGGMGGMGVCPLLWKYPRGGQQSNSLRTTSLLAQPSPSPHWGLHAGEGEPLGTPDSAWLPHPAPSQDTTWVRGPSVCPWAPRLGARASPGSQHSSGPLTRVHLSPVTAPESLS